MYVQAISAYVILTLVWGSIVSADPDFPIATFTGNVNPWQDTDAPQCDSGSPDGNFVFEERPVQGTQITEKSWILKCDDGSKSMRFLLIDKSDPANPLYSANEYFAKPDPTSDSTCEANGGITDSKKDGGKSTLETDAQTGAVISQQTITSTCDTGDTSEIRRKTLTSASGLEFTYIYAGYHHEVDHVDHIKNSGNNGQRGTTTTDSNTTCEWTTTPHYFPDYTRLDTKYTCKLPDTTVVTNVQGRAPPNSTVPTSSLPNNIKTTFSNGTTETITRRRMTLVTHLPAGDSGSCPTSGSTSRDMRDECCRHTITVTYRSSNFFNGNPTTSETTKTTYRCKCGGYVLETSGSQMTEDTETACIEETPDGCKTKTESSHTTEGRQQVDTTTTTVTCSGACTTTTVNSQYHNANGIDSDKSNEERTRVCPITYENKPATQTEVGTTYNNGSRELTTTIEGTDNGFRFGYIQVQVANPGSEFTIISTTLLNEISGGGRGNIVELPSPVPCKYNPWSDWTDCAVVDGCLITRTRGGKVTNPFTCTPSTDLAQEKACAKPGCGGVPKDCSAALLADADLCSDSNQTVKISALDTVCDGAVCLATCCEKSVEPVTGEEVKTCAMLLADDLELCSSYGEVDTNALDSDCDKNCDVNCCKHTETPVTGESVDTCFMLLVKDHDLCQGYIVDTDSLDNTCETNCDKNCCTEETPPATDSETKRTCAMWLADNSGLCTDQGNIVDKDSLSNVCENDCNDNCCVNPPEPATGEEVKTCAMLLADDLELCSSYGEVDTNALDSDCDKNCDVNCCKHTETPVTGESVDTCFMLLVKDHDLCQGYIVDTDSLDNTCETNCDKNCCTEETPPATDSETKRSCAMWLAGNSGLCTDQGNVVDKDSLSNVCENDCNDNCCVNPPEPVTGTDEKTCSALLNEDPDLCAQYGEENDDVLDEVCERNCDVNCCQKLVPEARTTCADVHLKGALDCGEERFDEASAFSYCEGDEDCTAACCIPKIEVPSLTYTHRETVSTHTATITSEDHTHVVTSSVIVNPTTETTHEHTTTYLFPELHPTEIASFGTTVTIEHTHTPVVTETVATVSTTEYYSHVETGHIPHPDGNIVLHTTRTASSSPTQSETYEPTTTTCASERATERTAESTTERTTTTREPEPATERTTTRAPEPTTETNQKPEPTPEKKYYCGDISYYKCSTYRTSLKCCKNSDKCTGWGNCKCTSTTCCDKTVSGAKDPDREITDGSDENNAYCGSVSNNKCEGYKTSRKCCKSGTGKCGSWAVEKCSSSYCCDGTVKATNSNCRRGSRRRECSGRR